MPTFRVQHVLLIVVIFANLLYHHARAQEQFSGGSISYKMEKQTNGSDLVTIELITGWVLGKGPCGPGCNSSDIGRSTRSTRPLMTKTDPDYLGNYTMDFSNRKTNRFNVQDMDAVVLSTYNETVIAVNVHEKWEQELLHFSFTMPLGLDELDVNFDGRSWRKLTLQQGNGDWHFQTTVSTALRSDTGQLNHSPRSFAKPYYRVKLGKVSEINIPAVDADGDYIKCDIAAFVEGGDLAVYLPPNVKVFENCTISINASESNGYTDDTWIGVPVSVRDYNRVKITYGANDYMPAKYSLSATTVQFLVQVIANLLTPEFVEPTHVSNHIFIMYGGTTLRTKIYAKAQENTTIERFMATLGIQREKLELSSMQQDPRRQVKNAIITWKPSAADIGRHIVCTSARDSTWIDSAEERCFILDVKGDIFNHSTKALVGKPYFVDIPASDQYVFCKIDTTCVVALYVNSKIKLVDVHVTDSFVDKCELGPIQNVTHNGETMYQTDLSFEHSMPGQERICFMAKNKNGAESDNVCIQSKIESPDPCMSAPCMNAGTCVMVTYTERFNCHCRSGYFGKFCEKKEDPCVPDPCVKENTVMCVAIQGVLCYCKPGFTGNICDMNIDDCHSNACNRHGICKDKVNGFDCECFSRYNGTNCETDICSAAPAGIKSCPTDTGNCVPTPCKNGATCIDEGNNYTCTCSPGFTGRNCEIVEDPCNSHPCVRGTCYHNPPLYHCLCPVGYTGKKCEISINECQSQPCLNGGVCVDNIGYFTCNCSSGYAGKLCEIDVNECLSQPCLNGGFCKDGINQFMCQCRAGFGGDICQNDINPCTSNPCVRGICFWHGSRILCECPKGFTGELCETAIKLTLNGPKETYLNVPVGSELMLNCSMSWLPPPTLYWSKLNGCGIKYETFKASVYRQLHATIGDSGTYTCSGSIGSGPNITKFFHVNITALHKDEVCDFDDGTLCGWKQQKNDNFDWTFQNGPTQSVGTGPDVDHTLGTVQGTYIYVESSAPRTFGEHASIISHVLPANRTMCFELWYYMFGDGSGQLFVYVQDTCAKIETELFKEAGDKGEHWNKASVTIVSQSVPNDYRIVLTANIGPTYHGDTAVDDLIIHDGPCQGSHGASIIG